MDPDEANEFRRTRLNQAARALGVLTALDGQNSEGMWNMLLEEFDSVEERLFAFVALTQIAVDLLSEATGDDRSTTYERLGTEIATRQQALPNE